MDTTPEIVNVNPYAVWLFKIKPRSDETLSAELETLTPLEKYIFSAGS